MYRIVTGNYNNYYNRIHKPALSTAALYSSNGMVNQAVFDNINFNRSDGINTELTINLDESQTGLYDISSPDYLLVCRDQSDEVISRWFILESHWNRERQFIMVLRRDLIADMWDSFSEKDFYCEKGPIPFGYDILKYNSEGMSFNSILKKRVPLKQFENQTGRYIVGYIDRSWDGGDVYNGTIREEYHDWEEFPLYKYMRSNRYLVDFSTASFGIKLNAVQALDPSPANVAEGITHSYAIPCNSNPGHPSDGSWTSGVSSFGCNNIPSSVTGTKIASNLTSAEKDLIVSAIKNHITTFYDVYTSAISEWNGKLIKVGDSVYTVHIDAGGDYREGEELDNAIINSIMNAFQKACNQEGSSAPVWITSEFWRAINTYCQFIMYEVSVTASSVTHIPSPASAIQGSLPGLPYYIFVLNDNAYCRRFVTNFASQYAGGNVIYDIQVLPFKPDVTSTARVNIGNSNYMEWAISDSVEGEFKHPAIKSYSGQTEYKKGSNLDTCRIYGPDGASCWEFNPAKIGGVPADSIRYEVTFAPLHPYMHIFPRFSGIYGGIRKAIGHTDTAESRGLICTGDYSIPYSTNNWATYQLQNSAYQLAHDRMIQNMSVMHGAEQTQEIVNAIAGSFDSSARGFAMGMAGGPIGAAVGGVIGGVTGLAGGIATNIVNNQLRAEEMSYAEDMFGYNLQNIRAQAQPLAHSNYLTVGVAYFPYIELYESDSTEEFIFEERLRVNGWTLGIVTTMDALKSAAIAQGASTRFVKGRLVEFDGEEDAHIANEINMELQRGVRFLAS